MPKVINTRSVESLRNNENYNRYYLRKLELIEGIEDYELKRKIICDLMFEPSGDFQLFMWDQLSEVEKIEQERRAQGKKRGPRAKQSNYIQE